MATLSFLEVVCAVLFMSVVLWQETAAISLSTQISTLPPSTTFSPKAAVCDGYNCPVGRKCAVDENHRPVCVCLDECPYTEDIVCGTDGRTYGNECQLHKEACPTDKGSRVAYKGLCLQGSVCYDHQCPWDRPCNVDGNNRPVCGCIQYCPDDKNLVCGSDRVTYRNICLLKKQACTRDTNLTVARTGSCLYKQHCDGVVCPSPKFCTVDRKNRTSCVCKGCYSPIIVYAYNPVCGSDNQTYYNDCHRENTACKTSTSITRRFYGVCSGGPNCQGIACQQKPRCFTVCPKTNRFFHNPVCGSNNKTYNNLCELERDACLTNTLITVQFNRRCEEGPSGCAYTDCPNGRTCVIDERNQPICVCPLQYCSFIPKEVCGTDNKTYTNKCFLKVAACMTNKKIRVQRNGKCREEVNVCDGFSCPKGMQCAIDERHKPVCVCLTRCPYTTDIVCGSDGRTYASECELQREACNSDFRIREAYKGYCLEGSVCSGHRCPSDKQCNIDENNRPVCVCNKTCSYDINPVCASDGVTYNNLCELKRQACITGRNITVARTGKCTYSTWHCYGAICPLPKSCVVGAENQTSCVCNFNCDDYYSPACGSDNKTYDNYSNCKMFVAALCGTNYNGVCSEGSNCQGINCGDGKHCDSQQQSGSKCVCNTVCPKFYNPVCGTNYKTYNNSCELQRDACLTNTAIRVSWYDQRCEEGPGCRYTRCPYGRTCVEDERHQPMCVCFVNCYAGSFMPIEICGSDNKTYDSQCLLAAAACMTNKTITVQRYERCKGEASTTTTTTTPIAGPP